MNPPKMIWIAAAGGGLALALGGWASLELGPRPVASASPPVCSASSLSLSGSLFNIGASGTTTIYTVTNTGSTPCQLSGMPIASYSDETGAAAAAVSQSLQPGPDAAVDLAVGDPASFSASVSNCIGGGAAAPAPDIGGVTVAWTFAGQTQGVSPPAQAGSLPAGCVLDADVSSIQAGVMATPVGFVPYTGPIYPLITKAQLRAKLARQVGRVAARK